MKPRAARTPSVLGLLSSFVPPSTAATLKVVLADKSVRNLVRKLDRSVLLAKYCTKLLTAIVFVFCVAGVVGML